MPDTPQIEPRPKKLSGWSCLAILTVVFCLFVAFIVFWVYTSYSSRPVPGQPLFEPSVEANYITSPLDANGDVDYVAYIDQESRKGVTPENNAMVPIVQAIGPAPGRELQPNEFFHRLGITPPPKDGKYFVEFEDWITTWPNYDAAQNEEFEVDYGQSHQSLVWDYTYSHPWRAQEFPSMAAYLEANRQVFDLAYSAANRQKFYYPVLVENPETPALAFNEYNSGIRSFARLLLIRSQLRLGASDVAGAIEDAATIVRLGEAISSGNLFIDNLVSIALRGIGVKRLHGILRHPATTRTDLQALFDRSNNLLVTEKTIEILSKRERFYALDMLQKFLRYNYDRSADYFGVQLYEIGRLSATSDSETAMIALNNEFERILTLVSKGSGKNLKSKLGVNIDDYWGPSQNTPDVKERIASALSTRSTRGRRLGLIIGSMVCSPLDSLLNAERRINSQVLQLRLNIAIELYQRDNGSNPKSLEDLCPKYIAKIPLDPYSNNGPFKTLEHDGKMYVYSIGPNHIDEQGRGTLSEHEFWDGDADDLIFEPQPALSWEQYLEEQKLDDELGGMGEFDIDVFDEEFSDEDMEIDEDASPDDETTNQNLKPTPSCD